MEENYKLLFCTETEQRLLHEGGRVTVWKASKLISVFPQGLFLYQSGLFYDFDAYPILHHELCAMPLNEIIFFFFPSSKQFPQLPKA